MSEKRMSPSLRRAWIEISASPCTTAAFRVALLAEGVDRNDEYIYAYRFAVASPSLRRAWIEIRLLLPLCGGAFVALLTEGVDRNYQQDTSRSLAGSRPPHGGRG